MTTTCHTGGRSSAHPNELTAERSRRAPVAIAEIDGNRYVIGAYGEAHWVRNLRVAGEGEIRLHGRTERIAATELGQEAARIFFGETLPAYIRRLPWFGRVFARVLFRLAAPEISTDPARAAATRPVFELRTAQ